MILFLLVRTLCQGKNKGKLLMSIVSVVDLLEPIRSNEIELFQKNEKKNKLEGLIEIISKYEKSDEAYVDKEYIKKLKEGLNNKLKSFK